MTRAQLKSIIVDDLGYEFGQKLPLSEISSFALATDLPLMTNPKDTLFEFDESLDLMYLWRIRRGEGDEITYLSNEPSDCMPFSIIEAIHMVSSVYAGAAYGHRAV